MGNSYTVYMRKKQHILVEYYFVVFDFCQHYR